MTIHEGRRGHQPDLAFESIEHLEIDGFPPHYRTAYGDAYLGNSLDLLRAMSSNSVNAVVTSPPYALHFKKEYGNAEKSDYVE